jgi:hypothetical protein
MTIVYSQTAINNRLQGVVSAVSGGGTNGTLKLLAGSTILSTIILTNPCGTVSGGVLTFTGNLNDPAAAATGFVTAARIDDSLGATVISGFTVGIPTSGADVIINNGANTLKITAGQAVSLISAQIIGS